MLFFKRSNRRWGMILLGVWIIALNLLPFLHVDVPWSGTIVAILGIAAGFWSRSGLDERTHPRLQVSNLTSHGIHLSQAGVGWIGLPAWMAGNRHSVRFETCNPASEAINSPI